MLMLLINCFCIFIGAALVLRLKQVGPKLMRSIQVQLSRKGTTIGDNSAHHDLPTEGLLRSRSVSAGDVGMAQRVTSQREGGRNRAATTSITELEQRLLQRNGTERPDLSCSAPPACTDA